MTEAKALDVAREYQKLGGTRLAKMDDNVISTRQWDDEPDAASTFWKQKFEILDDKKQAEVVSHLKSMNA